MHRDSIFYKLFQQYPNLLFTLLTNPPENAEEYRFDSVAVKEAKFEIDEFNDLLILNHRIMVDLN